MRALRLKFFQETACYTKPFSRKVAETYPLPPYSAVKGMIHAVLKAERLVPFSLSIQGKYETKIIDYRKTYMVKKGPAMPVVVDGLSGKMPDYRSDQMTAMPLYNHLLYNIELLVHITAKEPVLKKIYEAFSNLDQTLSIGRFEDIARLVEEPVWTNVEEAKQISIQDYSIYIPERYIYEDRYLDGIPYQLNWIYTIVNGIRQWEKIPSVYIHPTRKLAAKGILKHAFKDEENYPVFWNI